jgi:large subunit ribosomal protein L15
MQLQDIKRKNKRKTKKRIGRGGKRGTYSGRGMKGQKSRSGHRIRPAMRDIVKKLPKKRGYIMPKLGATITAINLSALGEKFEAGAMVTYKTLLEKKLIKKVGGKMPKAKILGTGELKHKLNFKGLKVSKAAAEKIKKAGGEIK